MRWDSRLAALFEDLEQRADGLHRAERDAGVSELARAEYSEVTLADRVHASLARPVQVTVSGGVTLQGLLRRAGRDWCLLQGQAPPPGEVLVSLAAVTQIRGLSPRAVPEAARPLPDRLGLASVLRRLSEQGGPVVLVGTDGGQHSGMLRRVGADFLELNGDTGVLAVPLSAVALVRG